MQIEICCFCIICYVLNFHQENILLFLLFLKSINVVNLFLLKDIVNRQPIIH